MSNHYLSAYLLMKYRLLALLGEIDSNQRCLFLFLLYSYFSLALCVLSLADTARVDIDVVYLLQVRHFDSIPAPLHFSVMMPDKLFVT